MRRRTLRDAARACGATSSTSRTRSHANGVPKTGRNTRTVFFAVKTCAESLEPSAPSRESLASLVWNGLVVRPSMRTARAATATRATLLRQERAEAPTAKAQRAAIAPQMQSRRFRQATLLGAPVRPENGRWRASAHATVTASRIRGFIGALITCSGRQRGWRSRLPTLCALSRHTQSRINIGTR